MDDDVRRPASSRWHDGLPIGERLSAQPLLDDPFGSIEGDPRMSAMPETGLPFWGGLAPNEHVPLHELSPALLATMGPVIQRFAGAIQSLDSVARTHFSRWGDGSAHFHIQFLARPLGMMQGRGNMLSIWDEVLPKTEPTLLADHSRQVAEAMAAGGGKALV